MSAAKGQDAIKYTATHMNMKLPPDQLKTRKGRDNVMSLVKTLFDNDGYHIQFNVLDTAILRDAQKHPENYRDLVVRVAGLPALSSPNLPRACRTNSSRAPSSISRTPEGQQGRFGVAGATPNRPSPGERNDRLQGERRTNKESHVCEGGAV